MCVFSLVSAISMFLILLVVLYFVVFVFFFFFKQKTAYEMRISDWSSDVCSSDLTGLSQAATVRVGLAAGARDAEGLVRAGWIAVIMAVCFGTCSGEIGRASCRERVCQYV